MPSFKPKTNKKIKVDIKNTITLDGKHKEILENFKNNEDNLIPEINEKLKTLKESYKNCKNIEEQLDIEDKIKSLQLQKKKIKKEKKEYYLNNANLVFDYFEDKKNIETNDNINNSNNEKNDIINSFFKVEKKETNNPIEKSSNNIVNKFLSNVDETFIDINNFIVPVNICTFCKNGEFIPVDEEGLLICNKCSKYVQYLIDNDKPSYKEPPKEVCFYAYKRINHFREILAQFQAKETTQIPEKVIEDIKNQIKKERIELKQITNVKAKEILKKLGYNKYYEHIPFIKDMIGIKPPIMTPELEDTLCNLFMEIQRPYAKFCPDDRVNFLNYYYTVYKLCELLDQKQFLPYFPMLKDREKRIEQDNIWRQICDELDWEFIPTI